MGKQPEAADGAASDGEWSVDLTQLSGAAHGHGTLAKFHTLKWKEIFQLVLYCALELFIDRVFLLMTLSLHQNKAVSAPCFHHIRLAGDDRALYDCFYRSFPHAAVSKARFVGVFRSVYGIDSDAQLRKLTQEQRTLCMHLERMKYCFERSSEGVEHLHWRLLLSSLRMFQEPLLPMREHFSWAFSVFASNGILEHGDSRTVEASEVDLILTHFLQSHAAMRFVSERIRQSYAMMPSEPSSRVSYRRFKLLLQQPPLQALLSHATMHTSYFDELSSPLYCDYVVKIRTKEHNIRAIKRLRYYHSTKFMRSCFYRWQDTVRIRKQTRIRMMEMCGALAHVKRQWAFIALQRHAMVSIAAIEIQRMYRGYRDRCRADAQWRLVQAAIAVQGAFRMRSHFVRFIKDTKKRNLRAIRIQRVYRGRLGRIRARKRLLEYYYTEMKKIQAERDEFRAYVRNEMAKRIQRFFHLLVDEKRERRKLEEAFMRRKMEAEMDEQAQEGVRQMRRYRQEVTKKYDKLREESEYKKKRKVIDGIEKQKVVRLRRQRAWEAFKFAKEQRKEEIKNQANDAYESLKREWTEKIAERARKRRLFVSQVLPLEEPGEWKQLQQELKTLVKDREKALAARYKATGVVIPKKELEERAQLEILDEEANREQAKAEQDWELAENDFLNRLDEEDENRTIQEQTEEANRRQKSALRIQCAFRMFAARHVLREEIRALFVKEYEPKADAAWYRNTFSGQMSRRKPFGLGSEELEYPDQWFRIHDATIDDFFFYNPRTMIQTWEKPDECVFCNSCLSENTFAAFWNAQDDSYSCSQCYGQVKRENPSAFDPNIYFPFDGSQRNHY